MKHNFKRLAIWQKAREFVKSVYEISRQFPKEEQYGLTAQIRRAAVSIPSNIAEGCGRSTNKQLVHFLGISTGSSCEVETQLYLAHDLEFIDEAELKETLLQSEELRKMIVGFSNRLTSDF